MELELTPKILSSLELQGVEKFFSLHGGWIIIGHVAHLNGNVSLVKEKMFDAVGHLLKRHPRMRSRLRLDNFQTFLDIFDYDEDYFHPNLFYSIIEDKNQSWQTLIENLCNKNPYQKNGTLAFPLFHFTLLFDDCSACSDQQDFHLILLSNHSTSDGRSGLILINDLLTFLTTENLSEHFEPINTEIVPCLDQIVPKPKRIFHPIIFFLGKKLFKKECRKLENSRIPTKPENLRHESTPHRIQPVKTNFLFTSSSSTLYSRLREKCRSFEMTLHGPLMACLLLSIDRFFPSTRNSDRFLHPLPVDVDFDLRPRLTNSPLTKNTVGYCVSLATVRFKNRQPVNKTSFWNFARKCLTKTNNSIENQEIFLKIHFFKSIFGEQRTLEKILGSSADGRIGEVNFSNIGKFPHSTDYNQGQIRLKGLHVINNSSVYRISIILFITCAGDEQFDISLAHEIETPEKAQKFLDYYLRLVETIADSDEQITIGQLFNNVQVD